MKQYSFSDVNRLSGEILEAALSEPVALTKYGKQRLVILPVDRYRALVGEAAPAAFVIEDAPDAIHAELIAGLDAILADEKPGA